MRPEELQMYDWVLINDTPYQVKQITRKKVGYHRVPHNLDYARLKDVKPIKITAEIFEKNGFTKELMYYYLSLGNRAYLQYYPHEWRLERWYKSDILFMCNCHYVHQLQQALRLCGIDKRIEL